MTDLQEYHFYSIYELANIIDQQAEYNVEFWNYNEEEFIKSATRFSKNSLLHIYIICTLFNYYSYQYRKNEELLDDEAIEGLYSLFAIYGVKIRKINREKYPEPNDWFIHNENKFLELYTKISDEIFYILFSNRTFLLNFNNTVTETLKDQEIPSEFLTTKKTIKRTRIPEWVKKAVYHRDKGRCVFCSTDLTGLINTLTTSNYDHIVPLDLMGTNDPCNIQLSCEKCNKSKTNSTGTTSSNYIPWWKK